MNNNKEKIKELQSVFSKSIVTLHSEPMRGIIENIEKSQSVFSKSIVTLHSEPIRGIIENIEKSQSVFSKSIATLHSEPMRGINVLSDLRIDTSSYDALSITQSVLDSVALNPLNNDHKNDTQNIDEIISDFQKFFQQPYIQILQYLGISPWGILTFVLPFMYSNNQAVTNFKQKNEYNQITIIENNFQENITHIVLKNVVLRHTPSKLSNRIGLVKRGQEVYILSETHGYYFIAYTDKNTGEHKAGYAFKGCFKK
ncbi:hypothetical protein [Flammeovirga sp. SubArs3]|uniref:hypothetical protein n=1 Tax=Flammeovirga sp. SubArs3 TaxID=2995316 RepID=UPI00248C8815|nr:hypothetical protein [Flammeovirga sp. SubArs3]